MNMDTVKLTDLKRKDFGSVEHRKDVAKYYQFQEQEVLDLPKREFKTLIIGIIKGNIEGKFIAANEIKEAFFCVPIEIWNHKKTEFEKILEGAVKEMKGYHRMEEAKNAETDEAGNDDSTVETEVLFSETENSEEL